MHKGNLFGYYILDLKDFYNIDKKAAIKESKEYIRRIKKERGLNDEKTKNILIILFTLTLLIGLIAGCFAEANLILFLFGMIFLWQVTLLGLLKALK